MRQRDRETERQRNRETERQRDRETERQRETKIQSDRETERQRHRETERDRDTETQRKRERDPIGTDSKLALGPITSPYCNRPNRCIPRMEKMKMISSTRMPM